MTMSDDSNDADAADAVSSVCGCVYVRERFARTVIAGTVSVCGCQSLCRPPVVMWTLTGC